MKLNQKGFTLIEILVVIAIIGVVIGVTSDIFIQIIKASNKANIVTEIKQNGDSVLNQLDRIIRNAEEIHSAGGKNYGQSWIGAWTLTENFSSPYECFTDICAFIVKNPLANGGYTKVEFHSSPDRNNECPNPPFSNSDRFLDPADSTYKCNGNIRIVTDITSNAITFLQNESNSISASTIGEVITNTEVRSGVTVKKTLTASGITLPYFSIRTVANKPTVITISFSMEQGIAASSRLDSLASIPFQTTLSLRSY